MFSVAMDDGWWLQWRSEMEDIMLDKSKPFETKKKNNWAQ